MRTGRWPTFAAVMVVIALLVALGGVLGDLPAEPFKVKPLGELHEPPNLSIYTPNPESLADVAFIRGAPYITVGTRLPVWPRGHAPLIGTITFIGIKGSAGPVEVVVRLPAGSTLALSNNPAPNNYGSERDNGATIGPMEVVGNHPQWPVSFTTMTDCETFFGVLGFTIKSAELAYAQGWGRQRLTIPYHASFLGEDVVKVVDDGSLEPCQQELESASLSSQAPGVLALTTNERFQRVSEATAGSDQTRGIHAWALPRGEADSLVVEATIENTLVRYVADLAPDLLFLVIGVLLGTISFRRGRRSRSREEP
jgi:hypothetical protein